jgi:acyl carrier protein
MKNLHLKKTMEELITACIYEVLAEGDDYDDTDPVSIERRTQLFGKNGLLDSNGLVTVIVGVEERLYSDHGVSVVIADERALSQEKSPFRTVESLADYTTMLIEEQR